MNLNRHGAGGRRCSSITGVMKLATSEERKKKWTEDDDTLYISLERPASHARGCGETGATEGLSAIEFGIHITLCIDKWAVVP